MHITINFHIIYLCNVEGVTFLSLVHTLILANICKLHVRYGKSGGCKLSSLKFGCHFIETFILATCVCIVVKPNKNVILNSKYLN
jgi:hypothetical protein